MQPHLFLFVPRRLVARLLVDRIGTDGSYRSRARTASMSFQRPGPIRSPDGRTRGKRGGGSGGGGLAVTPKGDGRRRSKVKTGPAGRMQLLQYKTSKGVAC